MRRLAAVPILGRRPPTTPRGLKRGVDELLKRLLVQGADPLVDDLSAPSLIDDPSWIRPGVAAWTLDAAMANTTTAIPQYETLRITTLP